MSEQRPPDRTEASISGLYGSALDNAMAASSPVAAPEQAVPVPRVLARANRDLGLRDALSLGFARLLGVLLGLFASAHKASHARPRATRIEHQPTNQQDS